MSTPPPDAADAPHAPTPQGVALPRETFWAVPARMPQPPAQGTNGQAVTSFVLGLLAIVPVSVVFGIVALVRISRTRQRGKGLAIAGLVLSALWVLAGAGVVIADVVYLSSHAKPGTPFAPGTRLMTQLQPGTCFMRPDGTSQWVGVVACDQPHDAQYLATTKAPFTSYGDAGVTEAESYRTCLDTEYATFPDPVALPGNVVVDFMYPTRQSWDAGSRQVRCYLRFTDGPYSMKLLQFRRDYTAVQLDFLKLEQDREVPAQVFQKADRWQVSQAYSRQVADAERAEAAWLGRHPGQAGATAYEKTLAADDLGDAARWDAITSATDQATWQAAVDAEAGQDNHGDDVTMVRGDLKLVFVNLSRP
ncbi:hypothetical protein ABIA33_002926 [Streptacidiphilus sp. MAP12-16]|uniref:DUF4190 domain-containing protein n=1 Tax=Streptacidiphilus sp. MAP12-16 TaxID=3156300 RepID=UPI00351842CA